MQQEWCSRCHGPNLLTIKRRHWFILILCSSIINVLLFAQGQLKKSLPISSWVSPLKSPLPVSSVATPIYNDKINTTAGNTTGITTTSDHNKTTTTPDQNKTTTTPDQNKTSVSILFTITDYLPQTSSPRMVDLLKRYRQSIQNFRKAQASNNDQRIKIDFLYVRTDNFKGNPTVRKKIDPNNMVVTFTNQEVKQVMEKCAYCRESSPWGWTTYVASMMAVKQLRTQHGLHYDYVWVSDPDAEFIGDLAQWILQKTTQEYKNHDLISTLIIQDVQTAQDLLKIPGMYSRIHQKWRWHEKYGDQIRFGIFTQVTMYSSRMMQAVEQHISEADFVELFIPYVCTKYLPSCRVGSLNKEDVGFINNSGNIFSGEQSAARFRAIATSTTAQNKWYHPTKFKESWMRLKDDTNTTTNSSQVSRSVLDARGAYGGKCASFKCMGPICDVHKNVTDVCLFVANT